MTSSPLHDAHARTVEWQAAFIQGIAASAIAFAIHETADRVYTPSLIAIGLSIVCWAGSFFFGIQNNHARQKSISANIGEFYARDMGRADLKNAAGKVFDAQSKKAGRTYAAQLYLLLAGALFYMVGHGMHIWENRQAITVSPAKPTLAPIPDKPAALRPCPPARTP